MYFLESDTMNQKNVEVICKFNLQDDRAEFVQLPRDRISTMVVIISQFIKSNQHVIHLKLTKSYMSIISR